MLVVGCSGSSDGESGSADSGGGAGAVADEDGAAGGDGGTAVDADRQVISNASATLTVDDPADGAQQVSVLVETAGGRVDERPSRPPPATTRAPTPISWCGCRRTR